MKFKQKIKNIARNSFKKNTLTRIQREQKQIKS